MGPLLFIFSQYLQGVLWRNNYDFKEEFAMKGFWKDYAELWKDTGRFLHPPL